MQSACYANDRVIPASVQIQKRCEVKLMLIMRQLGFLIPFMALSLLTGCFTAVNQLWILRDYVGYSLDYEGSEMKGANSLPPVLYRCGNDWYIAAVKSSVKENVLLHRSVSDDFYETHNFILTPLPDYPIYYHKITPEMAANMQRSDQENKQWFTADRVTDELKKAGGDWVEQLPPGAQPVQAEFLKYCRTSTFNVKELDTKNSWYSYPMAGLTFLVVDVPFSVAATSVTIAAYLALQTLEDEDSELWHHKHHKSAKHAPSPPPSKKRPHGGGARHSHGKHHKHDHSENKGDSPHRRPSGSHDH